MDASMDELLSPISDDNPCGEDLSFSPEFDRIHEARREDDPTLDYGEWTSALKQADWKAVVVECEMLLRHRTKDMRVAAWLTEGLIKTSGLAGLRRGLEVHLGLLKQFGKDIHPLCSDGDDDRRIGSMTWFIQRTAYLVRCVPLTESEAGRLSLMDYDTAVSLQLQLQRQPDSVPNPEDRVTLEKFAHAAAATDRRHFSMQLDIIDQCSGLLSALSSQLDGLLGNQAPSVSPLAESMEAFRARMHAICKSLGLVGTGNAVDDDTRHERPSASISPNGMGSIGPVPAFMPSDLMASNGIGSRADALRALEQVAAYFRRAEPHSPVAYLAEKALHWSQMPLHLWLRSVVKDTGVLSHLENMLGTEDRSLSSSE